MLLTHTRSKADGPKDGAPAEKVASEEKKISVARATKNPYQFSSNTAYLMHPPLGSKNWEKDHPRINNGTTTTTKIETNVSQCCSHG